MTLLIVAISMMAFFTYAVFVIWTEFFATYRLRGFTSFYEEKLYNDRCIMLMKQIKNAPNLATIETLKGYFERYMKCSLFLEADYIAENNGIILTAFADAELKFETKNRTSENYIRIACTNTTQES